MARKTVEIKTSEWGSNWIVINGRSALIANRITEIAETKKGWIEGVAQGHKFLIEGGRARGGTSRDWFLEWGAIPGTLDRAIHCTSIKDAVQLIENA